LTGYIYVLNLLVFALSTQFLNRSQTVAIHFGWTIMCVQNGQIVRDIDFTAESSHFHHSLCTFCFQDSDSFYIPYSMQFRY